MNLLDPAIPLCFDTSAIFGVRQGPALLRDVRKRFPERELILPAWVIAERVRQLRSQMGLRFDPQVIRAFLSDAELNLRLAEFNADAALTGWLAVTSDLPGLWGWEGLTHAVERPCAQRCRSGDYFVAAIAASHGAILVTDDHGLRQQMQSVLRGCVSSNQLRENLN